MRKTLAVLCFLCLLFCSACSEREKAEVWQQNTIVETYPDGSCIFYYGGDEYDHILFGENAVGFGGFLAESLTLDPAYAFPFSFSGKVGNIESYAFSSKGYIAYHAYETSWGTKGAKRYEWINTSPEPIRNEFFGLLDLNARTEKTYPDYTSLYADCAQNGITLGGRYICSPFQSKQEIVTPLAADYSLVEYPYELFALRKGQENLYFGEISDLQVTDGEITFQLTVSRVRYFPPASACTNADLDLKDPERFSFFQKLFGWDDLYKGTITIPTEN